MNLFYFIILIVVSISSNCKAYDSENQDGSYSIGLGSHSEGDTADSVLALLTKSSGYTLDENYKVNNPVEALNYHPVHDIAESKNLLSPHVEILNLIEVFLKFKAELASRLHAVVVDNWEIIRSVYMTLVNKIGTLHTFTLTGIKILRKVLEIAVSLMAQWQINLPSVSVDLNVGNQNGQGSFSINKNTGFSW